MEVKANMKSRKFDEDLDLLDRILLPLGIAIGLLGMGAGAMICFVVW